MLTALALTVVLGLAPAECAEPQFAWVPECHATTGTALECFACAEEVANEQTDPDHIALVLWMEWEACLAKYSTP